MALKGEFQWYRSLHQGGKKAISFVLTNKNMFAVETFDCAIVDQTGQEPPSIRRRLKLKVNEQFTFNYDTCGWNWCNGDYFAILGKSDKIEKRWDLNLKVYQRGACPECHGSHRCAHCQGRGYIEDTQHNMHNCQYCNGSGICQTCYVPMRGNNQLTGATGDENAGEFREQSRQRRIIGLQQRISQITAQLDNLEWELRSMRRKDLDVTARMAYMAQIELRHSLQQQLTQMQYQLQQLL